MTKSKSKVFSFKSRPQSKQIDIRSCYRRVSPNMQRVSPNNQQKSVRTNHSHFSIFKIENHCNSNFPYDSQSDSLEDSPACLSVNQESSGSEEQDVKMSVVVSEDKPTTVFEDTFAYDSQTDSYSSLEDSFASSASSRVNDVSQESSGSEDSFASSSVNDVSQESSGSEEQDVKISVAISEDKPAPAKQSFVPPEPSVSNHL